MQLTPPPTGLWPKVFLGDGALGLGILWTGGLDQFSGYREREKE